MNPLIEERLKRLVVANDEQNRSGWAKAWQANGGRVAGILCTYVPREILHAAGFLPWRVTGVFDEAVPMAMAYRPTWSSPRNTRILEAALAGHLDFVDAVIGTDWDIDLKRLWDGWTALRPPSFSHIMFVPRQNTERDVQEMRSSIAKTLGAIESFSKAAISPAALAKSVAVYRHMRGLIRRLYALRKQEAAPVSGAEVLGITTASFVMPPEQFNDELEALLPALEHREAPVASHHPRLLVSSDFLDDIRYMHMIEDVGCLIGMDDLDTGSRSYWAGTSERTDDPLLALAEEYLLRPGCPRMADWENQVAQILAWAREYRIDGVLELRLNYSMIRQIRGHFLKGALEKAGIPFLSLPREHQFANESQLRTRVGAFVEMLDSTPA